MQPGGQPALPGHTSASGTQTGGVAQPQPDPPGPKDSGTQTSPFGHVPPQVGALNPQTGSVVVDVLVAGVAPVDVVGLGALVDVVVPIRAGAQSRNDFRDRTVYVANWSVAWNVPLLAFRFSPARLFGAEMITLNVSDCPGETDVADGVIVTVGLGMVNAPATGS